MTRDDIPEELFDEIADQYYELGQVVQLEIQANNFLYSSGEEFKNEHKETAEFLRYAANDMKQRAKKRRKQYNEKYHKKQ